MTVANMGTRPKWSGVWKTRAIRVALLIAGIQAFLLLAALALHAVWAQPAAGDLSFVVLEGTISLPEGSTPRELEIDPNTGYVYVNDDSGDRVFVISGTQLVATLAVGEDPLAPVVNPATGYVYVANAGSDTVSVISGSEVVTSIDITDVASESRPAVNRSSGYVYVPGEVSNSAITSIISGSEHVVSMTLPMFLSDRYSEAYRPVVNSNTGYVYFPGYGQFYPRTGAIAVISGTELVTTIIEPDVVQFQPPLAVDEFTGYVYVAHTEEWIGPEPPRGIAVLSGTEILARFSSARFPRHILRSPSSGLLYVGTSSKFWGAWLGVISGTEVLRWVSVEPEMYSAILDMKVLPRTDVVYAAVCGYLAIIQDSNVVKRGRRLKPLRWVAINDQTGYVYVSGENGLGVVKGTSVVQTFPEIPLGRLLVDSSSGYIYLADSSNGAIWVLREIPDLLSNGSFEEPGRIPPPWMGRNLTPKDRRVCWTAHDGRCSFRMVGTRARKSLRQVMNISGSAGDTFTLGGWSKARNPLRKGGAYCLQAKVFHADGTKKTYRACFAKRTHGWQRRSKTFTTAKDYKKIVVYLLYYKQSGKAWFDHVRLLEK